MEEVIEYKDIHINKPNGYTADLYGYEVSFSELGLEQNPFVKHEWSILNFILPQGYFQVIRSGINDVAKFKISDTTYTVTLTEGNYIMSELLAHIQVLCENQVIPLIFSYSRIKNVVQIQNVHALDISFIYEGTTCEEIFGLSEDLFLPAGETTSLQNAPDINNVRAIFIHSNLSRSKNWCSVNGGISDVILSIPVLTLAGTLTYTNHTGIYSTIGGDIDSISIRLTDQQNQNLDNRGVGFTSSFRIRKTSWRPRMEKKLLDTLFNPFFNPLSRKKEPLMEDEKKEVFDK